MWYNVRIKTFPDGHKQYFWSENPIQRDIPDEFKKKKRKKVPVPGDSDNDEREKRNLSRAVNNVYDLARSNEFDWFITLTLDPQKVNRFDYDECTKAIRLFTKRLYKLGCSWLIVPEQHKDGAYHFHGLVAGNLPLTDSGKACYNKETGETTKIYNLANYEFGFTTATKIAHPQKTASYIAKYLTKQISVPKGKKCYWASKSLSRPAVDYVSTYHDTIVYNPESGVPFTVREHDTDWIFGAPPGVRYVKEIETEYGRYVLSEE